METNRSADSQRDETDDARETDPCLVHDKNLRKSLESLNKNRENDNNSSVLESEKNKNNENANSYNLKQENKKKRGTKTVKFTPPPPTKFEKWCSEKTGLSRTGLLLVGLLIFILLLLSLTLLIMSCLWPASRHYMNFPVCRHSACLLASAEVTAKLNQSYNPCDSFREFSCGQWFSTTPIPRDKSSWNMKQQMQFKHRGELRDMITTMAHPTEVEQFQWRLKNIYDSCMSVGSIQTEDNRPLRKLITYLGLEMISEQGRLMHHLLISHALVARQTFSPKALHCGGWHVLRDFSFQMWDMKKTLRDLHAKYNIQPFFSVEVVPDARSPSQSIIQISPGNLGLPDKSYYYRKSDDKVIQAYKLFIKDVAQMLGATSTDASSFADDLFGFEKRLAERFPSRLPDRAAHYRPTIAKLEDIAPSVPFFDILSYMFPDAKLTKKSEVVVIASDHLVNVSLIISTTDSRSLNDYMMWRLTLGYIPYLSKKYRSTIQEFHRHLYGTKELTPRWEMCIETLQKYVGYGMEAMFEGTNSDAELKRKVVTDIFENIRRTLRDAVQTSKSLPTHVQEHFLDKLDNVEVQVGLPLSMRHTSYYNDFYRSLTSIKDDFFQNILYAVSFNLEEQQRRLTGPSEEHKWMDIVSDGQLKVAYVPEINKVIVPMSLLSSPYFHSHYPLAILYGGLGTELGLALLGAITGRGVFHAGDGALLPPDHPASNGSHDCFLTDAGPASGAVKHTFSALNSILASLPHTHQPALELYEDQNIFFMSYAQSICTMKTRERQDVDSTTLKTKLDDSNLLEMLMAKSKIFTSTFNCPNPRLSDPCYSII